MRYISTRGGVEPISFSEAVMMGLATDGGLLLPESIPGVDADTLKQWSTLTFQELAVEVMLPYMGDDISREELTGLIERSYASFSHAEITPVVAIGDMHILELFHGPTAAFKDVALQFLGNLFELLLERSGDHPHQRVSPIQERQMTTVLDDNVHNIAIKGTFDDGQSIVKQLFNDLEFKQEFSLGAVNSINWARILAQVVYYFYAWGRITKGNIKRRLTFSVPTGNFGDIFAGYIAMRMGLPVDQLVLATNRNDILSRFVNSGVYEARSVHHTMSPSMDIQISSNFERYLYYLMDEDPAKVRELMENMARDGRIEISDEKQQQVRKLFQARAVGETETQEQIRTTYRYSKYILDPHTAIGVKAAEGIPGTVCLATAHPAKFGDAVIKVIGVEADPPPSLQGLMDKKTKCAMLDADSVAIKNYMQETLANR